MSTVFAIEERVKTINELKGIPAGTCGTVVCIERAHFGVVTYRVLWDLGFSTWVVNAHLLLARVPVNELNGEVE